MGKLRQSNFELLRFVAMFFILCYHQIIYYVQPTIGFNSLFQGIQLTLHTGVLLFVLISGYFGIHPTFSGGGKLLIETMLYYLPLQIVYDLSEGVSAKTFVTDCLFWSHGPYWFIRTYLLFYLFVPIVNKFLKDIDNSHRIYALVVLAFINFWFGRLSHGDPSLVGGKNIVNFAFLYIVGDTIRYCRSKWQPIKMKYFIMAYLLLNIGLQLSYNLFYGTIISHVIYRLGYGYDSPVLLLNAILLFLCFAKINITSSFVNRISASVLAAYLITDQPFIKTEVIGRFVNSHVVGLQSQLLLLLAIVAVATTLMVVSILIDQALQPLWRKVRFPNLDAKLSKFTT